MMRSRVNLLNVVALSAVFLFPSPAFADTIRITSGFLQYDGPFDLTGDRRGFRIFGSFFSDGGPNLHAFCGERVCTEGDLALVRHVSSGLDFEGPRVFLDGVFYPEVNTLNADASAAIGFTTRLRLPAITTEAVLRAPFMMDGSFRPDIAAADERFTGSGLATMTWRNSGVEDEPGKFELVLTALRYDFFAANPIPEPTTMILAGVAGAAAALGRRRRRAR